MNHEANMARKQALDYHVVPRTERESHEYDGADCRCEPRCVLEGDGFRLFVHQTHLIDVLKMKRREPPKLLGPGKE